MARIYQREKIWYVDYNVNGRRVRKRIGKSKQIAELALKDVEVKIAKGELGLTTKDQTLDKLFKEFIRYSETNHSPNTQKRYKAIIANLETFLGEHPYLAKISHLVPKTFEDYKAYRKGKGASNKTINIELQTIRAMFNLAVKWHYCKDNPTKNVSTLKEDNNKKPRFLSQEECARLLEACNSEQYPIFYTFLYSGMRKGELENLEWSDIDFDRRKIKISIKDEWRPKTTEREIPINVGLLKVLLEHKKTKKGTYVFHKDGQKIEPNSLRKQLIRLGKKAKIKDLTKIHTLRHTFASHLVMSGVDLPTVGKLLGHADIETTMIYAHLADEHIDKAVENLKF